MPKISFANLPKPIIEHIQKRVADRNISFSDLRSPERWKAIEPYAPAGDWYKDFGSFILCGTDEFPKTVLSKGMTPYGKKIG